MKRKPINISARNKNFSNDIYDSVPTGDEDLWFLRGPDEGEDDVPGAPPLPSAGQSSLVDLPAWQAAEAAVAVPLAQLASRLGALDERLRRAPEGWRQRLAMIEAAGLSWLTVDRVSLERLSLWQMMRLRGLQEDNHALIRTGWAYRRLAGGVMPVIASPDDIMQFLGRQDSQSTATGALKGNLSPGDETFSDQVANWCEQMSRAAHLHPITQAVFGKYLWGVVGLAERISEAEFEATVLASRMSVVGLSGGALFLPLAGGGVLNLWRGGTEEQQLQRFIDGAGAGTLASLRHLDQLEAWQRKAATALGNYSGRTPRKLLKLFADWPLVAAPMAEVQTGASRAAIQRNLKLMAEADLIQEITGQGRYRVWRAHL